jgi:5-methyltetrahydrofolate--homocysteine methyltransferase
LRPGMPRQVIVTDGAWGTQLQAQGLPISACPEAWNLQHPDRVEAVARAYVAAGSQVILTNTFGANRIALARHGLDGEVAAINRTGVAASRRAAGSAARVFASIGPIGAMLAGGEVTVSEARDAFTEQARFLADAGADALVVETMTDLREAELAVRAAGETGLTVVACILPGSGSALGGMIGEFTFEQAVEALAAAGAAVLGANCMSGSTESVAICCRLRAATDRPIWMKPSAGLPDRAGGASAPLTYPITQEQFVETAAALVEAGADFIGGCCGTTPAFIRALIEAISKEARG